MIEAIPAALRYAGISAAEKAVTRESMQLWDDLIAPKIVEKNGKTTSRFWHP